MAWLSVALAVWVASWSFPPPSASTSLDFSCGQALSEAWKVGLPWGTGIAFTYGPLGWCAIGPYDADTFWFRCVAWELLFKGVWAVALAGALTRTKVRLEQVVLVLMLVVPVRSPDAHGLLALTALAAWMLFRVERRPPGERDAGHWMALALVAAACSVIALVKFSWLVLFALATVALAAALPGRDFRRAAATIAVFLGGLVLAWGAAGGSPAGLLRWIEAGWELSTAYGASMSLPPRAGIAGTAWVALLAACVALFAWAAARPRSRVRWCSAALALAACALAHKAGMTRGGGAELTTFAFLSVVPWLFAWSDAGDRPLFARIASGARLACALACVVGFARLGSLVAGDPVQLVRRSGTTLAGNLRTSLGLRALRTRREEERARLVQQFDLPRTRAAVGADTLDVFGSEQGLAFLNGLAWTPRPVFQAYAAYTPWLSGLNARFLAGEHAPRHVLFRASTIDRRLPGQDDARSLDVLLRDYEPLFPENGHVLLRRRAAAPLPDGPRRVELERAARFGEEIAVPRTAADRLYVSIAVVPRLEARARALLTQADPPWIRVVLENGVLGEYRLLPAVAREGIRIEPWLDDHAAWLAWCGGERRPRVRTLQLLPPTDASAYETAFQVRVWSTAAPDWAPAPDRRAAFLWPMFDRAPLRVDSRMTPLPRRILNRADALVVGAPSEIVFELPPGRKRVAGSFGLLPAARWSPAAGTARFSARVEDGDGVRTVFEGSASVAEADVATTFRPLAVEFDAGADARFVLAVQTDSADSDAASAAFWSGISFSEVR